MRRKSSCFASAAKNTGFSRRSFKFWFSFLAKGQCGSLHRCIEPKSRKKLKSKKKFYSKCSAAHNPQDKDENEIVHSTQGLFVFQQKVYETVPSSDDTDFANTCMLRQNESTRKLAFATRTFSVVPKCLAENHTWLVFVNREKGLCGDIQVYFLLIGTFVQRRVHDSLDLNFSTKSSRGVDQGKWTPNFFRHTLFDSGDVPNISIHLNFNIIGSTNPWGIV